MGSADVTLAWTPEKTDRFKKLVLRHVENGGTVLDACQQFEFETNGVHKAKFNKVRWSLFIRPTCKEEFKQAVQAGRRKSAFQFEPHTEPQFKPQSEPTREQFMREEPSPMLTQHKPVADDEVSSKLLSSMTEMLEDRRQMKLELQDYKSRLDLADRKITDLEEDRNLAEVKLQKKDQEIESQGRLLLDSQFKYEQLSEDYQQTRANHATEYDRLQQQLKEMQAKYEALNSDYSRFRMNSTREVERLELQVRDAEIKTTQLTAQYDAVRADNAKLTRRITDFAHQISNMLGPDVQVQPTLAAVPIRPVVAKQTDPEDRAKA